ncbi:Short-chain dehydrogenase/reductase family protein [Mycena venus]|uniref:Short-chain dehydrogenase/reductase family protein n=1 Tax=Mycena venus TaxID=2733690 RepID=A0A8H7DAL2_9AGAR|nr:Short-chain dehydrogenase/reductase family protein [Mycena venus]
MSFPTFGASTTAEEVAAAFCNEIQGKNVLITGTSLNSLGFETARAIARFANLVIITGYNAERLRLSEAAIKLELPTANIRCLDLDLSSLAAVRKAAEEVNAYPEPIHVLIHNAAATIGPFKLTVDNLESQIATDSIGPFLFTKLILPKIYAAKTATYTPRVVALTSIFHEYAQGIDFADIRRPNPEKYQPFQAYNQAKSANVLVMAELSRRAGDAIHAYSVSPGVALTNIQLKPESIDIFIASGIITPDGKPNTDNFTWKTIPQSAATTLVAAFDPRLDDKSGAYLDDCNVAEIAGPNILDAELPRKLWSTMEKIIGESFVL